MMAYGKGYFSGLITFLRSFALLLLFLTVLPRIFGLTGVWLAVPAAEVLTLLVSAWFLRPIRPQKGKVVMNHWTAISSNLAEDLQSQAPDD